MNRSISMRHGCLRCASYMDGATVICTTFVMMIIVQPVLYGHDIIPYFIGIKSKLNYRDLKIPVF